MKKLFYLALLALAAPLWAMESTKSASNVLSAAEDVVTVAARAYGTTVFQLTGTWVATITFETTADGTNYVAVPGYNQNSGASATTATANGIYMVSSLGSQNIRARVSAYTSGTINVTAVAVEHAGVAATAPGSATSTVNVGTFPDNEPVNVAQINGVTTLMGNGVTGTGSQRVTIASDNTAFTVNSRVTGNGGAIVDAANNAAAPASVLVTGLEAATQGTTQPTAATAGNVRRPVQSTDGAAYVRQGGPVTWSCGLDNIAATLTECQAAPAAGLKLYISGVVVQSTTGTAGQFALQRGTGVNCVTGTAGVLPSATTTVRFAAPPNTIAPTVLTFPNPIALPAAEALCVLGVATNTTTIQITGYTAP